MAKKKKSAAKSGGRSSKAPAAGRVKSSKAHSKPAKSSAKSAKASKPAKPVPSAAKSKPAKPVKPAKPPAKASLKQGASKPAATKSKGGASKPVASPVTKPVSVPRPAPVYVPYGEPTNNGDLTPLSIEQLRKVRSGLNAKDLAHFRELLMEKRAELLGDVKSMNDGARNASGGNLSHMPVHMADIGSDNYDQEFTLGLVESEARLLREIDEALIRIREGYYGVCMVSGKPIVRARLEAKPWAKYSIEVAREMEKRGLR